MAVPDNIARQVNRYDVLVNYHASGSATKTTGTISSSSASLAVASNASFAVGHGILVVGAGASGANLVTSVTAINGTTITLAATAGTGVSGAVVQHDDTVAINNAIADAMNNGGGCVWFALTGCDGHYRCNGPFNGTTYGILTFPQNLNYVNCSRVELVGEVRGQLSTDGLSIVGGVGLDFSDSAAPSGGQIGNAACISAAPYVKTTTGNFTTVFNAVEVYVDSFLLLAPPSTQIHGLQFSNAIAAQVGDNCWIVPRADSANTYNAPSGPAVGVWLPQWLNNVDLYLGRSRFVFWPIGVQVGEHTYFRGTYVSACLIPLYIPDSHDLIEGWLTIEQSPMFVQVDPTATLCPVRLIFDNEVTTSGGPSWQQRGHGGVSDINDANNTLSGLIEYKIKDQGDVMYPITTSGAANLTTSNLEVKTSQSVSLSSPASSISFTIPPGYNNIRIVFNGRSSAATTTVYLNVNFNGDTSGNYNLIYMQVGGSGAVTGGDLSAQTAILAASVPGTTVTANQPATAEISIPAYANTTFDKNVLSKNWLFYNGTLDGLQYLAGIWKSTAAIASVVLTLSSGNFVAGTTATLYLE